MAYTKTERHIKEEYYLWLVSIVYKNGYSKLLSKLYSTPYYYALSMDSNRESDGINLRYRFADEQGYDQRIVAAVVDCDPCSLLEMMIALSIRCEEDIMSNPNYGNRTSEWFWDMISSLGLAHMNDSHYDDGIVNDILERFLNNDYDANGHGGLFTVNNPPRPMYLIDIWSQMNEYLNTLKGEVSL